MQKVLNDNYLGDIISADGSNKENLKDRIGKGHGCISEIMSILDTISFGSQYYRMFTLLRESMFINSILTNAEIWFGLKESELSELEDLDRFLLRKAFQCPISTPKEAGHLELGLITIGSLLKYRRLSYLHYILKTEENGMLRKFFNAMYENPSKDDWTVQASRDLKDLNIKEDFEYIKSFSEATFKKIVKKNVYEFALDELNQKKFKHTKMDNLVYTELKIQDYLLDEDTSTEQKRNIFRFRTMMSDFAGNYSSSDTPQPCKMCLLHRDCQAHAVICHETMKYVTAEGNYEEIFSNKISKKTACMLEQIIESRNKKLG